MGQILLNLIGNAIKFVAPNVQPAVRIRAEVRGAQPEASTGQSPVTAQASTTSNIRVWIEDNGIGIAPEHQDKIFQLFGRLRTGDYPGTGIGLAIVKEGVRRMGGQVGVESAVNQGSSRHQRSSS